VFLGFFLSEKAFDTADYSRDYQVCWRMLIFANFYLILVFRMMASIGQKESISEWAGLVVSRVHENDLLPAARGEIMWRALPVQLVKLPVDDLSEVAVLSWRSVLRSVAPVMTSSSPVQVSMPSTKEISIHLRSLPALESNALPSHTPSTPPCVIPIQPAYLASPCLERRQ
jgi:hypothetical protein